MRRYIAVSRQAADERITRVFVILARNRAEASRMLDEADDDTHAHSTELLTDIRITHLQ